jgi:hypothetical protein
LQTGVVGLSLSLAGAACAESSAADASLVAAPKQVQTANLHEEEVFDVTVASFYMFDKENPGGLRSDCKWRPQRLVRPAEAATGGGVAEAAEAAKAAPELAEPAEAVAKRQRLNRTIGRILSATHWTGPPGKRRDWRGLI